MRPWTSGRPVMAWIVGAAVLAPLLAMATVSERDLRMKERLVELSQSAEPLDDLRMEMLDGNMAASRHYEIVHGRVVSRVWDSPGVPGKHEERRVRDAEVRALLRALIEKQYWMFQGTRFIPDNTMFLFRIYYKDWPPVDYRCDVEEYIASPQRAAIRAILLDFVAGTLPATPTASH